MVDKHTLLDSLPIALLLLGTRDRIEYASPAAGELLGPGLAGGTFTSFFRNPNCLTALAEVRRDRVARSVSVSRYVNNAETFLTLDFRPYGADGRIAVLLQDETPARQVSQRQRDFVANVSHELRTPLTAIMGYLETLMGPARNDPIAQERFLSTMLIESERMKRLIDDLLTLSRVQSQERQRPQERVDLSEIIDRAAALQKTRAGAMGVSINIVPCEAPAIIRGDADQLTQVFSNLLENAVKYGAHPGQVRVRMVLQDKDPILRLPVVVVLVCDDGQGIESHHIARLTERFYRIDTHRSREMGGTGLGLAIVKHIMNRHHGRLVIQSTPGQGSCFSAIFPLEGS